MKARLVPPPGAAPDQLPQLAVQPRGPGVRPKRLRGVRPASSPFASSPPRFLLRLPSARALESSSAAAASARSTAAVAERTRARVAHPTPWGTW